MPKLVFKADEVRRVVEHSLANAQAPYLTGFKNGEGEYAVPGMSSVLLVHDHGVYLMSNGSPRDIAKPDSDEPTLQDRAYAAYAEGCNPHTQEFDDWWEKSRALVGGDDFVECLPWAADIKRKLDKGATVIEILISESQLRLA